MFLSLFTECDGRQQLHDNEQLAIQPLISRTDIIAISGIDQLFFIIVLYVLI